MYHSLFVLLYILTHNARKTLWRGPFFSYLPNCLPASLQQGNETRLRVSLRTRGIKKKSRVNDRFMFQYQEESVRACIVCGKKKEKSKRKYPRERRQSRLVLD